LTPSGCRGSGRTRRTTGTSPAASSTASTTKPATRERYTCCSNSAGRITGRLSTEARRLLLLQHSKRRGDNPHIEGQQKRGCACLHAMECRSISHGRRLDDFNVTGRRIVCNGEEFEEALCPQSAVDHLAGEEADGSSPAKRLARAPPQFEKDVC